MATLLRVHTLHRPMTSPCNSAVVEFRPHLNRTQLLCFDLRALDWGVISMVPVGFKKCCCAMYVAPIYAHVVCGILEIAMLYVTIL